MVVRINILFFTIYSGSKFGASLVLNADLRSEGGLSRISRRNRRNGRRCIGSRSKIGDGRFRSNLDPAQLAFFFLYAIVCAVSPPGAHGGTYGSGCFQLWSNFSVSANRA